MAQTLGRPTTELAGASAFVLQSAINAYTDEAYTNAKKIINSGIVSTDATGIDPSTETFIGQMRWRKPLNPQINVASLTSAADGAKTSYTTDYSTYIKSVRTHGAEKINMAEVVSQEDGLLKIGRDFAETRAQDEHNALLSILKGVAVAEALNGCGTGSGVTGNGGQTFDNDPNDASYGFYVDLGSALPVVAATSSLHGAARAEGFLQAMGMAWKDYEPPYLYLFTSPAVMASLRSANLVDVTKVAEAGIEFETIFGGKFRLVSTRANQSMSAGEVTAINLGAGATLTGAKTSFLVLPGAIAKAGLNVPVPTEIHRNAASYNGGGTTDIWYRWGYILHPAGYDWVGAKDKFASDADYKKCVIAGTPTTLDGATVGATTTGTWVRKASSALSLGILPVFHA